jgi:uncharacterized membrane protein YeaQ/YmgE (transglycosylase-associated protein family)
MDLLLHTLIAALLFGVLAFVAALLLRTRQSVLGYVGAGFIGNGLGLWLFGLAKFPDPLTLPASAGGVAVLATFLGALIVLLLFRLAGRARR